MAKKVQPNPLDFKSIRVDQDQIKCIKTKTTTTTTTKKKKYNKSSTKNIKVRKYKGIEVTKYD